MARKKRKKNLFPPLRWFLSLRLKKKLLVLFVLSACLYLSISYYNGSLSKTYETVSNKVIAYTADIGMVVTSIDVEGRHMTDEQSLLSTLNLQPKTPIFDLDLDQMSKIIETQIPWVVRARVERRLPNKLHIDLEEIVPLARWQVKDRMFIIGKEKTVAVSSFIGFEKLPLVTGKGANEHAPDFLLLLNAEPMILDKVEKASRIGDRRWNITLDNGLTILLPELNTGLALSRLSKMEKEKNIFSKQITQIDLRLKDKVFVQPIPEKPNKKPK